MRVYVIRHGQSEANLGDYYAGWLPVHLSDKGRRQAENARDQLRGIRMDRVFCSDLQRAKETAAILFPDKQAEPTDALREIGVGKIEGLPIRECEERWPEEYARAEAEQDFSFFGGESSVQMRSRIHLFLWQLDKLGAENIAIVGHEGTVRETLNFALNQVIPLEHLKIDNASVSVFEVTEGRWKLLRWNHTGVLA